MKTFSFSRLPILFNSLINDLDENIKISLNRKWRGTVNMLLEPAEMVYTGSVQLCYNYVSQHSLPCRTTVEDCSQEKRGDLGGWDGEGNGTPLKWHPTLAWKIPWMEEPGRLQSMGSLRVAHDSVTSLSLFTFLHWRRKRQPTPVFLPGESQGRGSLVGCRLCGCTESDMTEAT